MVPQIYQPKHTSQKIETTKDETFVNHQFKSHQTVIPPRVLELTDLIASSTTYRQNWCTKYIYKENSKYKYFFFFGGGVEIT